MSKNLIPFDPDKQPGSGQPEGHGNGEQVHYHYYDHRTYVQGDADGAGYDENAREEEPQRPRLAGWQKVTLAALLIATVPLLLVQCGLLTVVSKTETTTNVVDITTDDGNQLDTPAADQPPNTRDMLANGSAKACSQDDVRETVDRGLRPKFEPTATWNTADIETGQRLISYELSAITLAAVDRSVGSVTCDATVSIASADQSHQQFTIEYLIRPSVEDDASYVIQIAGADAKEFAKEATERAINKVWLNRYARESRAGSTSTSQPDNNARGSGDADMNVADQ